jgi:hypothetical protein
MEAGIASHINSLYALILSGWRVAQGPGYDRDMHMERPGQGRADLELMIASLPTYAVDGEQPTRAR